VSAPERQQPLADDNGDRKLPEGASHLLAADDDVVMHLQGLCGRLWGGGGRLGPAAVVLPRSGARPRPPVLAGVRA
jgi:hypothetical protein